LSLCRQAYVCLRVRKITRTKVADEFYEIFETGRLSNKKQLDDLDPVLHRGP